MSINSTIPLFQMLTFKVYRDDIEWCAKSVGSYDILGTTIEITAPSRFELHQQLYSEVSELVFGDYEADMIIYNEYTIEFLLTQNCIPLIGGRKST